MAKRKESSANGKEKPAKESRKSSEDADSSSDDDMSNVDVDFELFDPQPAHDFHGLKTLLRQLFDVDGDLFDLSALTDLILAQPLLGSTVKVEGNESDPYAFLTVLNLQTHRDVPVIQDIRKYLHGKASESPSRSRLRQLLSPESSAQVGLILTERLINIPAEVVPPMYGMLLEEITWALEEKEPYEFTDYIIISKTYKEVESSADREADRPRKKSRGSKSANINAETFYFHVEDEVLQQHATEFGSYAYSRKDAENTPDSRRAFQELGIRPQGHIMLIPASKLEGAVQAITRFLSPT
ncbi:MAG: U2 snRNP complex subunit [Watsoniomyces obsoletus]|nr:MAG: U2 snRNP complex subunit [Watsoniomyces obsoletus]